jgi:cytochrome c oxidase subunit 2
MTYPSVVASQVDELFFWVVAVCALVFLGILACMIYLGVKYRARAEVDRSAPPLTHLGLELAWTIPTLIVFVIFFLAGASLYSKSRATTESELEVFVVAKQWMWKFQHSEGQHEIDVLHLPVGKKIKLTMISEDVIHSFFLPDFRIKQDLLPGRYTTLMLGPKRVGTYPIYCSQYCGARHARMLGEVRVLSTLDFARWKAEAQSWGSKTLKDNSSLAAAGRKLFEANGCISCHSTRPADALDQNLSGPSLWNIYRSQVTLRDGKKIIADENYIHRSVYEPNAMIVKGFSPQMPTFEGIMSDEDFQKILAYLKTLVPEKNR